MVTPIPDFARTVLENTQAQGATRRFELEEKRRGSPGSGVTTRTGHRIVFTREMETDASSGSWGVRMQAPLTTERLALRPFTPDDLEGWFAIWGDPEVIGWGASPSLEDTRPRYAGILAQEPRWPDGIGWLAVRVKGSEDIVGDVVLKPAPFVEGIEVGWHFRRHVWRRGYATEAAEAILDRAFQDGVVEIVYAAVATQNAPSRRVAGRPGMTVVRKIEIVGLEHELLETSARAWRQRSPKNEGRNRSPSRNKSQGRNRNQGRKRK